MGWHVKASIKDVLQTSVGMNAPEGHCSNPSLSLCSNVRGGRGGGSGWQGSSLTMCPTVKICPGSYSVSV